MAESNKGKSFDIVPGNPKADPTARPIIVRSGPMMRDPSIIDQGNSEEDMPKSEEGMISQAKTITIKPISDDDTPKESNSETKLTPPQTQIESSDQPKPDEEVKENESLAADAPAPETTKEEETKPEAPASKAPEEETPVNDTPSDASLKRQELKQEEVDKEHLKKLDQLVESERYFLPINMREKRQNRRVILIGVLICIVLAIVWVDVALDAGLISNSLHLPHTHFFVATT